MSDMVKSEAAGQLAELPEHLRGKTTRAGLENLGKDDVTLPRIGLAQAMSPELKENDPKYIEGLKQGQMFNSLNKHVYGKGPLFFTVIRVDKPRWVEFNPRDAGGGVKDPNVPAGDPRTQFGQNGELPAATKFYDFLALTFPLKANPIENIVTLSFKSSGLKVAKKLNTLMTYRGTDCYAGMYQLGVTTEKNAKGEYFNFTVDNVPAPNSWLSPAEYKIAEEAFKKFATVAVNFDREPGADDGEGDTSFDANTLEGEAVKTDM